MDDRDEAAGGGSSTVWHCSDVDGGAPLCDAKARASLVTSNESRCANRPSSSLSVVERRLRRFTLESTGGWLSAMTRSLLSSEQSRKVMKREVKMNKLDD